MSTWGLEEDQAQKQQQQKSRFQTYQSTYINGINNSKSITKFVIKYEQKDHQLSRDSKSNRYSTKKQYGQIRLNRISQSVLEKNKKYKDGEGGLPSYLRPTESSAISAKIQQNRKASMLQLNNQNKTGALIKLRSKSLEQEDQEAEKQYNRVPIQYFDQKNYGCGADSIRARVIFRGYAPKNTYFYVKTLKPFKRKVKKPSQVIQSTPCIVQQSPQKSQLGSAHSINLLKNDFDIRFQSKFESGNLSAAAKISQTEYWLYMRQDTNTHGLRQWFYFAAMNRKPIRVKFRIYKFTKSYSLYRMGMKPYIRMQINGQKTSHISEWFQGGQKIKYDFDNNQKCFFMEFQFKFQEENQQVEFAMLPPYTYSMLKEYLKTIQTIQQPNEQAENENLITGGNTLQIKDTRQQLKRNISLPNKIEDKNQNKIKVQVSSIGETLAGLNIPLIKIIYTYCKMEDKNINKQAIIILARTHPGQTVSNFALQSFIDNVLVTQQLAKQYDFYIIPMINPDGVYFGNHRTSVIGQDLNRNFNNTDFQVFPEIQAVNNVVNKIKKSHKIRFIIDLHGHSARKNIFAYGDEHQINSSQYLHTRILPKLLNDAISSFKYDHCIFKQSKQKKNTARVYYTNKYKINCLTIQQSYGLLDEGTMGVHVWRNFGEALANSLLQFAKLYATGKQKALADYLKDQIAKQAILLQKRIQKHKKMFGLKDQNNIDESYPNKKIQQMQATKKSRNDTKLKIQKQSFQVRDQNQDQMEEEILKQMNENQANKEEEDDQKSINMSELSSGDQDLQMQNEDIQILKKQIIKVGCFKQGIKRQKYNLADKKLQLFQSNSYSGQKDDYISKRLHQQKSSMIPRIVKLQIKRKEDYNLSFKRDFRQNQRDIIQKQRIQRRKQIQQKFKRMELPLIKR